MKDADGIVVSDPIFEEGASGLFHTIMDRFGPRTDRGNNIIGTKVAEATNGKIPDPRILKDKVISFMGVGGSDWGTRVQCEHAMLALTPMWKIIDNSWFPWAKELIMDDNRLKEVYQICLLYTSVVPNPTCKNVHDGLDRLKGTDCDFLVSIGGGSPQDTAKAIGILATTGGHIKEYEGVNISKNKSLQIVAVNTTAGTSSEVTINYVVTDEERHVKMVMVDKNSLATVTVNDPELMVEKPASLTAATGMDALTHAIERCV